MADASNPFVFRTTGPTGLTPRSPWNRGADAGGAAATSAGLHALTWPTAPPQSSRQRHRYRPIGDRSKQRSWVARMIRKYKISTQKIGLCVCLALALAFLLYHYLAPRFASPTLTPHDDAASGWSVPRGPSVVVVQSPEAARLEEAHKAKLDFEAELLAAQVRVPVAGQPGLTNQLDQFYNGRLKEQRTVQSQKGLEALEAQGEGTDQLEQAQQAKDEVVGSPSTSVPTSPIPPATLAPVEDAIPATPATNGATPAQTQTTPSTASAAVSTDATAAVPISEVQSDQAPAASVPAPLAKPVASHKQRLVHPSSLSPLTAPPAPLDPSIDPSRLYDTAERRAAREAALVASLSEPLPASVRERKINNVPLHKEKPLNEEWREMVAEKLQQKVKAPGIITSLTSPDGGLELSLFLDPTGRVGYSLAMRAEYSSLARSMLAEGLIESLDEAEGTFLRPALLDLSVDQQLCLLNVSAADSTKEGGEAELNWRLFKGFSLWHPVPKAERSEYAENFTQLSLWNGVVRPSETEESVVGRLGQCGSWQYQFRVFNTGFAVRALVQPPRKSVQPAASDAAEDPFAAEGDFVIVNWSAGLRLQDGAVESRCVANNYEEPFVRMSCAKMADAMMTPLTIEMAERVEGTGVKRVGKRTRGPRFLTVAQAGGEGFVRSTVLAPPADPQRPHQTQLVVATRGEAPVHPGASSSPDPTGLGVGHLGLLVSDLPSSDSESSSSVAAAKQLVTPTSWHVVMLAPTLHALPDSSHLVPLLCEPPSSTEDSFVDSRWVPHGKLIRITKFSNEVGLAVTEWAAKNNFNIVHFDAGWYGDEYKKTSSATQVLDTFAPVLDIGTVAAHANALGLRVCLYVNELALRDTLDLVRIYAEWGVGGVKFGFVEVGDPRSMRILHARIVRFGQAGMYINVHDSYRPRGLSRTYPFLVTQEGVRGEERKPDAAHHTMLPFVRTLQGAADYTPRYLTGAGLRCTKAHQLALPLLVYSPIQSLFWAEPLDPVSRSVAEWNPELRVWTSMPTVWDDTRFMQGRMAELAVAARRDGSNWFVGALTNGEARSVVIDLAPLWADWHGHPRLPSAARPTATGFLVHVYRDGSRNAARKDPSSVKVQQRTFAWLPPPPSQPQTATPAPTPPHEGLDVLADGKLHLDLAPSGGAVLFLTPATPEALAEAFP